MEFYDFPYIGNNHPNWLSYFSEGIYGRTLPTSPNCSGWNMVNCGEVIRCHQIRSWSNEIDVEAREKTWNNSCDHTKAPFPIANPKHFGHQARKALPQREVLIPLSGCHAGTVVRSAMTFRVSVKNGGISWYITIIMVVMVVSYNIFVGYIVRIVYIYHSILVMVVSYKM